MKQEPDTKLTEPHQRVLRYLLLRGVRVEAEYPWPPYILDCYLPRYHAAVEIDGPKHSAKRDSKRDDELYQRYMIRVFHIKIKDAAHPERWWTKLAKLLNDLYVSAVDRRSYAESIEW